VNVIWLDDQGACLFSERLDQGRLVWPSPAQGRTSITSAELDPGYVRRPEGVELGHDELLLELPPCTQHRLTGSHFNAIPW
jgi:hypothetical protein